MRSLSRRCSQGRKSVIIRGVMQWLFKEEPSNYSYDDLVRDGRTSWTGVRNPVAQRNLRAVKKGDSIFFYHTGKEKAVIGIARAADAAYVRSEGQGRKALRGRRGAGEEAEESGDARCDQGRQGVLRTFVLTRVPRLSVMPVSDAEWKKILEIGRRRPVGGQGCQPARTAGFNNRKPSGGRFRRSESVVSVRRDRLG